MPAPAQQRPAGFAGLAPWAFNSHMVDKEAVLGALARGRSFEAIGSLLGIHPGQAYMIATGLPADGSDSLAPEERERPGYTGGSTQELVNPPAQAASAPAEVLEWLQRRAKSDAPLRQAAGEQNPASDTSESRDGVGSFDRIRLEHNTITQLLDGLKAIPAYAKSRLEGDAQRRQALAEAVLGALDRHESSEPAALWAVIGARADAAELVDTAAAQQAEMSATVDEFRGLDSHDAGFDEQAAKLVSQFPKHVALADEAMHDLEEVECRNLASPGQSSAN